MPSDWFFDPDLPWRKTATGLAVAVRLTPRGGRDGLDGIAVLSDGRTVVKARVRAAAEDGAANAALTAMLARATGLPASAARLAGGHKMRLKTVELSGEPTVIVAALGEALGLTAPLSPQGAAS
ncbi:DUF167 family protein [Chelatococcus sp. GCM10030263]|uniref:DUF167 family protein n=1 Tax=Chelatococcus sp. GCM10030263 TaxID=3273387 RepID=UPI00361C09BD